MVERHQDDFRTVFFGEEAEEALVAALVARGAERVLLLATPGHPEGIERLAAALGARAAGTLAIAEAQVPLAVAEQGRSEARALEADWVVAHGGGTAVGLAKAVALTEDVQVAAVATTYAGSEMTNIWGITEGDSKTTGRDERVRPVVVAYDPGLTTTLPVGVSLASGLNALAHAIEALYAVDATDSAASAAAGAARWMLEGLAAVVAEPGSLAARATVLRGAWKAGVALDGASMALHHKLAHVLGGTFGLPHARVHAALLPYTLGYNAPASPAAVAVLSRVWRTRDPVALLHAWCEDHGVTVRLSELDFDRADIPEAVHRVLQHQYPNPRPLEDDALTELLEDAWHGRRPRLETRRVRLEVEGAHGVLRAATAGASLESASAAVLLLHGRGAVTEAILGRLTAAMNLAGVHWLAPQATGRTWYPRSYAAPVEDNQPWLGDALATVQAAYQRLRQQLPAERIAVVGFSQGACLAMSWLSQAKEPPGALFSFTGAPTPGLDAYGDLSRLQAYVSTASHDPWMKLDIVRAGAERLTAAGAEVTLHVEPGDRHAVHPNDRLVLRRHLEALVRGDDLEYLAGFGAAHMSEALPNVVPRRQNGPRKLPYGLYAEQINGTGFTVRRAQNHRVWLYRIRPQIHAHRWTPVDANDWWVSGFGSGSGSPEPLRLRPQAIPEAPTDFLAGVRTFAGAGDPSLKAGMAVHAYACSVDMEDVLVNLDGDLLFVPQQGALRLQTELGWLHVAPGEIAVVPRGIRFRVLLPDGSSRGWMSELYEGHLQLPERGVVGANGLADERHFRIPVAAFEDAAEPTRIIARSLGGFFATTQPYSPFDVVGWHGSYTPCKYDLADFHSMGSVQFDHPDPSVLTVLTAPHDDHGRNVLDVAVFKGRWDVTEHTFRPPFFHRNSAIEFNMVIASEGTGGAFPPGTSTYTPYLSPHGVSSRSVRNIAQLSDEVADQGHRIAEESLWLQFESTYLFRLTDWARNGADLDQEFLQSFADYPPAQLP